MIFLMTTYVQITMKEERFEEVRHEIVSAEMVRHDIDGSQAAQAGKGAYFFVLFLHGGQIRR